VPVVKVPRYVLLSEAAQRYNLELGILTSLVEDGRIDAVEVDGEVAVTERDVASVKEDWEQFPSRSDFKHLQGKTLGIAEASRKYNIPNPTLSRWSRSGYIKRVGHEGQKVLLDESDVAYCAAVYRQQDGGQGKRIFDRTGKPYIPKNNN
jgi:predicted site-specific integrase-resolvase